MSSTFRRLAGSALLLVAAACSDSPTAPAATVHSGGPDFSLIGTLTRTSADTTIKIFTVDPSSSTTFQVGSGHIVYFPRNSICDLGSSYGPGEWDRPCSVARSPITITAKTWIDASGQPQVDFSPAMRFTNSAQQNGYGSTYDVVMIALAVDRLTAASSALNILYCATPTSSCVDESLTDPSLKTSVSLVQGYATRRIKHFSGYNVSSGRLELMSADLSRGGSHDNGGDDASRTGHLMSSGRSEQ